MGESLSDFLEIQALRLRDKLNKELHGAIIEPDIRKDIDEGASTLFRLSAILRSFTTIDQLERFFGVDQ